MMKTCIGCGESKPEDEFWRCGRGLQSRCKKCGREYASKYYARNKRQWRGYELKRRFGDAIDLEGFDVMLREQGGRCPICGEVLLPAGQRGKRAAHVDHDHESGRIRGLLCGTCNRGLGLIGEGNLETALSYLNKVVA